MDEQEFGLGSLKGIWRRRWRSSLFVALGILLITAFVAAVMPNWYESQTVLLIEPQTVSERLVESGVPETELNNRLHLLQMQILSRGRLSKVIDDLDVYPELENEMTREGIIDYMREDISVTPLLPDLAQQASAQTGHRNRGEMVINTFVLHFRHRSAQKAADVANRLSRDFIDEHIKERVLMSSDTSQFIDAELANLTRRIGAVEARIKEVKSANPGKLPEDFVANQRLYERATMAMRDAQRELSIATSDESFYRQQALVGIGEMGGHHPALLNPSRRLDVLEVTLAEYGSRGFTEKHPDVIAAREEVSLLRAEISAGAEGEGDMNRASMSARAEEQRAALRAGSARQEIERLMESLASIEARLAATPAVAEQLSALEREHDALLESYQDYSGKRVEASVAAAMESRQKGERFRVLEAAYPEIDAASPNRPLILALGLLLAFAIAGGWLIMAETVDESYHDGRSLQDRLGLPVLAAIPNVMLASDIARRRARDVRQFMMAGVATVAVLLFSVAGNWWVNGAPGPVSEIFESGSASE